ncbi:uncharacterized protein [Dermacentor albipictus]|uniref:uncharacterized protein n=1 Tax=Dermacentor albipictus TaxID=60249 RepID=UPI0038FD1721
MGDPAAEEYLFFAPSSTPGRSRNMEFFTATPRLMPEPRLPKDDGPSTRLTTIKRKRAAPTKKRGTNRAGRHPRTGTATSPATRKTKRRKTALPAEAASPPADPPRAHSSRSTSPTGELAKLQGLLKTPLHCSPFRAQPGVSEKVTVSGGSLPESEATSSSSPFSSSSPSSSTDSRDYIPSSPEQSPPTLPPSLEASVALNDLEGERSREEDPAPPGNSRPSCVLSPLLPLTEDAFSSLPPPGPPPAPHRAPHTMPPRAKTGEREKPAPATPSPKAQPSMPAASRATTGATPPSRKRNRRRRRRSTSRAEAALAPIREPCDTVLFRPVGQRNFRSSSKEAIVAQLSKVAGAHRVRVNFRLNVVAVDALPDSSLAPLIAVADICDVPVRAAAAPKDSCTGVLFGVDTSLDPDTVRANIDSAVPVLGCYRAGPNFVVRFSGSTPPQEIALFKMRRPVNPRRPRPTQCRLCGAFGHVSEACVSARRCLRCGGSHSRADCTARSAKCLHCGGRHSATEPRCPDWQRERRIAETVASSIEPITRHQAAAIVRDAEKTAPRGPQPLAAPRASSRVDDSRTFADVANNRPARPPVAGNTSTPSPAVTVAPTDPRDAVIALLAAALKCATELLPHDSPARTLCAAALAAHGALTHHGS